jgi:hypothetical protein
MLAGASEVIALFCKSCLTCQRANRSTERVPLKPIFTSKPKERLVMDFTDLPVDAVTGKSAPRPADQLVALQTSSAAEAPSA